MFDLSQYLKFEVQRGDEDSADSEELSFNVVSKELKNDFLYFDLEFENPTKVSTGSQKDVMVVTIEDDAFFMS